MNTKINQLINYGLENQMISLYDVDYSINMLLDLFKLDCFERTTVEKIDYYLLIEDMLDYAVKVGLIEDNITERDLFDTKIMNCIMPRPSEVVNKFYQLYDENKQKATQYFYDLSIHSNLSFQYSILYFLMMLLMLPPNLLLIFLISVT